jgi:hypothetical protein
VLIMRATLERIESWQGPIAHHIFGMSHERDWLMWVGDIAIICWYDGSSTHLHCHIMVTFLIICLKILKAVAIYSLFSRKKFWHLAWLCWKKFKNKKKLFFPHGDKFKKSFFYQITKGINIRNLIHYPIG